MPPSEDIQNYLTGAWRMMTGKPDGMRLFDVSADGFWSSFFAIVVALPAMGIGWVSIANELGQDPALFGGRFAIFLKLAIVDISAWVVPLAVLALAAGPAGIADRFVHYVVSSNWGSVITVWLMLPPSLLRMVFPGSAEIVTVLSVALFGVSMVLTWRLTNAAIGKGPAIASALFAAIFVTSVMVLLVLQSLLGLSLPD